MKNENAGQLKKKKKKKKKQGQRRETDGGRDRRKEGRKGLFSSSSSQSVWKKETDGGEGPPPLSFLRSSFVSRKGFPNFTFFFLVLRTMPRSSRVRMFVWVRGQSLSQSLSPPPSAHFENGHVQFYAAPPARSLALPLALECKGAKEGEEGKSVASPPLPYNWSCVKEGERAVLWL